MASYWANLENNLIEAKLFSAIYLKVGPISHLLKASSIAGDIALLIVTV